MQLRYFLLQRRTTPFQSIVSSFQLEFVVVIHQISFDRIEVILRRLSAASESEDDILDSNPPSNSNEGDETTDRSDISGFEKAVLRAKRDVELMFKNGVPPLSEKMVGYMLSLHVQRPLILG